MAIAAALYPFWGVVAGGVLSSYFIGVDGVLPISRLAPLLLAWVVLAAIEERMFRIPFGRHILGACVLSLCWFGLWRNGDANAIHPVALVSQTLSRSAAIALAWVSRPDEMGMVLTRKMNSISACIAIALGGVAAYSWQQAGIVMMLVCVLILRLVREWYYRRFGGISPTALSLTQRATELSTLLIAVFMQHWWRTTSA